MTQITRIDTHQHLVLPNRFQYPWTEKYESLQGQFSLEDYQVASRVCGIQGTLFMEADVLEAQAGDEAHYFCQMAEQAANGVWGVIASGRPEYEGFENYLDGIEHPRLKGIRRVLHVVPDEISQRPIFRQHIAALAERNLSFDLCARSNQLPLVAELVDACPETQFILDHCGGPDIAHGQLEAWAAELKRLAQRVNLVVKISGLPAYCPPGQANAATLRPWVETTIETFGWDRCLWGGDWPVCTLNGTLRAWCAALDEILAGESESNQSKLYVENARRIYRLS